MDAARAFDNLWLRTRNARPRLPEVLSAGQNERRDSRAPTGDDSPDDGRGRSEREGQTGRAHDHAALSGLRDFLPTEAVDGLLDFALAHEADFAPTRTGGGQDGGVKPDIRVSLGTRELGPFKPILKDKLRALVPDLVARLRVTPVDDPKFELELVAHNDGAFYTQHIDTQTASDSGSMRVLSGVYYFHAEPKAFSGGALRLYAIGDPDKKTFVDIAPEHNTLLVFPSWAPHEVMPIGCPSGRFADSRFAINCWVHRKGQERVKGFGSGRGGPGA